MRLTLRDLRSLERRSMYSIFAPLNTNERLPRELLAEARRHRMGEIRHLEVIGALYLPAMVLALVVMGSVGINAQVAFGVAGVMFVGFILYVALGRYR